jgi:hypothetical protein
MNLNLKYSGDVHLYSCTMDVHHFLFLKTPKFFKGVFMIPLRRWFASNNIFPSR